MKYYTSKEAAELIGIKRNTIQYWCKKWGIQKHGRDYRISEAVIERLRKRPNRRK